MLRQEGAGRSFAADWKLGCSLAAVAGAVNAAGFFAVGYYSANMTGNLSALSTSVHDGALAVALSYAGLLAAFVSGAVVATVLVNLGRRRDAASIYAWDILLEAALLALLGAFDLALPAIERQDTLAFGLSFLMGLQNATVTRISGARVRTTHMTGMLTDVGIALADWLAIYGDPAVRERRAQLAERLRLHLGIVCAFALGGIAGAFSYARLGPTFLLGVAALLVALALPNAKSPKRDAEPPPAPPAENTTNPV
ncbi:YoaK family protein [Acidomonas methanolica]|uniref:YoaK family protein n=1 Tax=Acidomonas methanolica TaxID=437 RepID=UPI00211A715C|nr:YoaK family protein [Acidomonas methanolica]MCQ9155112.1 DUF1275 domain-containing protein [Acidomonas methanolica]